MERTGMGLFGLYYYLNTGTGYDCAGHISVQLCARRVRTVRDSSPDVRRGATLPTGSTKN